MKKSARWIGIVVCVIVLLVSGWLTTTAIGLSGFSAQGWSDAAPYIILDILAIVGIVYFARKK